MVSVGAISWKQNCSPNSWQCVFLYKEKTSSCAAARGRELHVDFQKKQMLCGKKLDLEPSKHFPEPSATVLLFSVKMYEDSCEITDVDMGPCLRPAGHPAWAVLQGQGQNKGLQNCTSSWLGRVSGGGQKQHKRRRKGKMPKSLVMTPPKCLTARYY